MKNEEILKKMKEISNEQIELRADMHNIMDQIQMLSEKMSMMMNRVSKQEVDQVEGNKKLSPGLEVLCDCKISTFNNNVLINGKAKASSYDNLRSFIATGDSNLVRLFTNNYDINDSQSMQKLKKLLDKKKSHSIGLGKKEKDNYVIHFCYGESNATD